MAIDERYVKLFRNYITGMNTKSWEGKISTASAKSLKNIDLSALGRLKKIRGYRTKADDVGANGFTALTRFNPLLGSDVVLGLEGTNLRYWNGGATWSSNLHTLTAAAYAKIVVANNKAYVFNGVDNVHSVDYQYTVTDLGSASTNPPKGLVAAWFRERLFVAVADTIYYSDVGDPETFDQSALGQLFKVNIGDNDIVTNIVPLTDNDLIIFKNNSIWWLDMSTTSDSRWYLKPVDLEIGCVSYDGAVKVGKDIFFMSNDGVRSLYKEEQDKILGASIPVSDPIETDIVDSIYFLYKTKIRATYFKNRVIFAVPNDTDTVPKRLLIYHIKENPNDNGWSYAELSDGVSCFVKYFDTGEEKLYFGDTSDGQIYELFYGTAFNADGIPIEYISRSEDLADQGLQYNRKTAISLCLRFLAFEVSEVNVYIKFDDGSWIDLGTVLLYGTTLSLPFTLPASLGSYETIIKKFNGLDKYGPWYRCQVKVTQESDTLQDFELLDYGLILTVNDYEEMQ